MQIEQFKILRTARAMGEFTKPELVQRAGVDKSAVYSLFRRHGDRFFEETSEKRRTGDSGNRAPVWRLKEASLEEIDSLLDTGRAASRRELIDKEAAEDAIADDHARWQARVALFNAIDYADGPAREQHLQRCRKWLSHEERRLRHWGSAVEIPQSVRIDLDDLCRRKHAVECGIDLFASLPQLDSYKTLIEWIVREARRYGDGDKTAFAPLQLSKHNRPEEILAEAALLSPEFEGKPSERIIVATIAALPNVRKGRARSLLCGMLDILAEKVGYALEEAINRARPSERQMARRMVLPILIGFQSFPELLKRSHFATALHWYDNLPWSQTWDTAWAPFWAELSPHTHKNPTKVRQLLGAAQNGAHFDLAAIMDDLRQVAGAIYDRFSGTLKRQIELYEDPPTPPLRKADWLTSYELATR